MNPHAVARRVRQMASTEALIAVFVDERDHLVVGLLELPGEKSRGGFEDLVHTPGFSELAFEALVLLLQIFSRRRLGDLVAVAVAPHAQCLFTGSDLRGDGSDGVRARPSLSGLAFQDHPHSAPTQLKACTSWACSDSPSVGSERNPGRFSRSSPEPAALPLPCRVIRPRVLAPASRPFTHRLQCSTPTVGRARR